MLTQLRMCSLLYLSFAILLLAACGPSAEEVATMTAAVWTDTPTATATATVTSTATPTPTSTPTLTPTPIGGGRVVFLHLMNIDDAIGDIVMSMADGSQKTLARQRPGGYWGYPVSPDGSRVLSVPETGSGAGLVSIMLDGSNPILLTDLPNVASAVWSPDGSHIGFIADYQPVNEWTMAGSLYILDASGSNQIFISSNVTSFEWSPDGKWLAYSMWEGFPGNLYIAHTDGNASTKITSQQICRFSWLPDSSQLAFSLCSVGGGIRIFNIADKTERVLSGGGMEPSWAPDGKHIAYITVRGLGNVELFIRDIDGGDPVSVTSGRGVSFIATAWTTDGLRLAFVVNRSQGNSELYVVDSDGSNLVNLSSDLPTDCSMNERLPWSPDGSLILLYCLEKENDTYTNSDIFAFGVTTNQLTQLTDHPGFEIPLGWAP